VRERPKQDGKAHERAHASGLLRRQQARST
jgi:hypothetical protein